MISRAKAEMGQEKESHQNELGYPRAPAGDCTPTAVAGRQSATAHKLPWGSSVLLDEFAEAQPLVHFY